MTDSEIILELCKQTGSIFDDTSNLSDEEFRRLVIQARDALAKNGGEFARGLGISQEQIEAFSKAAENFDAALDEEFFAQERLAESKRQLDEATDAYLSLLDRVKRPEVYGGNNKEFPGSIDHRPSNKKKGN
jgi:hypothetical protein